MSKVQELHKVLEDTFLAHGQHQPKEGDSVFHPKYLSGHVVAQDHDALQTQVQFQDAKRTVATHELSGYEYLCPKSEGKFQVVLPDGSDHNVSAKDKQDAVRKVKAGKGTHVGGYAKGSGRTKVSKLKEALAESDPITFPNDPVPRVEDEEPKYSHEEVAALAQNIEKEEPEKLEAAFWEWYPHEGSWKELQEANPQLFEALMKIGRKLVQLGKLKIAYLPKKTNYGYEFDGDR
jgi:hypothetical protein